MPPDDLLLLAGWEHRNDLLACEDEHPNDTESEDQCP
jgi:hypothetical protein